jgi:hypothetical protein
VVLDDFLVLVTHEVVVTRSLEAREAVVTQSLVAHVLVEAEQSLVVHDAALHDEVEVG